MDSGATERKIFEKKLEKRLQHPEKEPLVSLPLHFLQDITCGFSAEREIIKSEFGAIYKGVLRSGKAIAVKKIRDEHLLANDNQVNNEILCLVEARHQNVVLLVGYCVETKLEVMEYRGNHIMVERRACLLCFEFLQNGSLNRYLFDNHSILNWDMRYEIIRGVCRGLHYLHDECRIVHLDLKPQNILMDTTMMPKIADFGLSRLLGEQKSKILTKNRAGTLGYMANEYIEKGIISYKTDIFSLGVTIIQIITGQRDYPSISERTETSLKHYTNEVVGSWMNRLVETITPMHLSLEMRIQQLQQCIAIALKCLEPESNKRPTSLDIVQSLNAVEPKCASPGNLPSVIEKGLLPLQFHKEKQDITSIDWIDTAMKGPVTASLGPMTALMGKVYSLEFMSPTQMKVSPSDDDIKHFKKHLEVLWRDLLEPEETSSMPKWWRKEVRELLYDTEDRLDKVILLSGGDFSELIAGVDDAYERRNRLKLALNDKIMNPDPGQVRVSCLAPDGSTSHKVSMPISANSSCIVGLNEFMGKLIMQLAFDDHNQKGLKVVPILGFPGVGKTTAAGILYHEHRGKFQCSAFVRVSRTPDMRSLLISILLQIKAPWIWDFLDVHDLIDAVKEYLKGKMYLIILDGLWTASVWDIIRRAFPDGNYGSRIVTTTQINDVALACCRYYPDYIEMNPLNDDQSRRLFFTIVFDSEDRCPSDFKQVSYKIIKKCAGLPLAIVNVASLLRRGSELSMEKWERIQECLPSIMRTNCTNNEGKYDFSSDSTVIGSEGGQLARGTEIQKWKHTQDSFCSTFEGLKEVLMFIYNTFPPHLKTCLLYLSMYPEGYAVRKHDLVTQWVAEGFMNAMGGRSAEEIAGDYFDELVHSGIVQPVDTKHGSKVLSCTVHHMVLDVIRHKSKEMNFVITVDHSQSWLALPDQVRRLSIQFGGAKSADIPEDIEISKLRSLLFFGFIDCVPSFVDYEFLRVLILDIWADGDETELDLTRISELLRLRYLKIQCNVLVKLPDEISGLKYLETLEVDAILSAVPSDIDRFEKLLHLLLPSETILPRGYDSLTSLLTLGCFDLSKNSSQNVIDLSELTNLQDLRLTCSTSTILSKHLVGNMKHLALILGKLNNLRSLVLNGAGASSRSICDDSLSSVSPSPALLEKLELRPRICTLSRLPKWIGKLSRLTILKIEVVVLSNDDIAILEGLASLTALSLRVLIESVEWIFEEGFPALRYFKFVSTSPYMCLLEGAMPNVQKLKLAFNANRLEPEYHPGIFSFKHMTSLTEVTVKLGGANADKSSKGDVERVMKDAFSNHPSSPVLNLQWVDCIFSGYKKTDGKDTKQKMIAGNQVQVSRNTCGISY